MLTFTAFIKSLLITLTIGVIGGGLFIYSGLYPIGADIPHNKATYWVLQTLRERSVERAARNIRIPEDLNTADRLLSGGADYNFMCAACHLVPDKTESDFTIGLYPSPPNLAAKADANGHALGNGETADEAAIRRQS